MLIATPAGQFCTPSALCSTLLADVAMSGTILVEYVACMMRCHAHVISQLSLRVCVYPTGLG